MRLIISQQAQRAVKIAKRRDAAKNHREHKQWHLAQAAAIREHAKGYREWVDNPETELSEADRERADKEIFDLLASAMEHENAKCLDDKSH
ncbi:hypothetical protein SEA_BIRDFEEDER_18 [Microbacterium phage Birdfeeder]|nr:hypothetical protein SEA_BIRDFEEDER_18 [Microbacterium phage Birdfeeder]